MHTTRTRTLIAIGALALTAVALVGCSAGAEDQAAAAGQSGQTGGAATGDADQSQRQMRGVSGEIAAVSDGLLQVQDAESQTAVSYTDDTAITQQIAAQLSDLSVGSCITGIGGSGSDAGSDSDSGSGSADAEASTPLTSVTITQAVDGECSLGMGGGGQGGEPPEGFEPPADGEMPEGAPDGAEPQAAQGGSEGAQPPADGERPEGMPQSGFGGFVGGKVTAIDGSTLTIDAAGMDGETSSREVVVDDATVFTRIADATSDALAQGACVTALGEYSGDEYAATSLAVSEPGDDGCNAGFGAGFAAAAPNRGGENG